jgi:hypothetical protein
MNEMNNRSMIRVSTALVTGTLAAVVTGCTVAKDVFKAGMWVGVLALVAVLLIMGTAMSLMKRA